MIIPKEIDHILKIFEDAGYEAYLVGGCVRDSLLSRPIHDWDITTSANPNQIMSLFCHCIPTGIQHGTVTVIEHDLAVEITTYRVEEAYLDSRHPSGVRFVSRLQEDLARRDFTINAMAMDRQKNLVDYFNGQQDLSDKIIRCVGDPQRRFSEDALRMFRAIRFCAQLNFSIDLETNAAITAHAEQCASLSAERIRDELQKTLCSEQPQQVFYMVKAGLLHHMGIINIQKVMDFSHLSKAPVTRWAAFCLCAGLSSLAMFRLDKKTTSIAQEAVANYMPHRSRLAYKQLLAAQGWEVAACVADLAGQTVLLQEIQNSNECVSLKQLAIGGKDLQGISGPETGYTLQKLLSFVLEHPTCNDKACLLQLVATWKQKK